MRKLVIALVAIAIIVAAVWGKNLLASSKKEIKKEKKQNIPSVFVERVSPQMMSLPIEENGLVRSSKEIVLSVEVQGLLESGAKPFKTGYSFKKGDVILALNNREFLASVKSQRSAFMNLAASIMPDIQLDFPNAYAKWKLYVSKLNVNKRFSKLPPFDSDSEALFLSGKGLTSSFYQLQSMEEKMTKFRVVAPFDGVLTQHNVEEGTLVRPGQQLGVFTDNKNLEVEVAVNAAYMGQIKVGDPVAIQIKNSTNAISANVQRINATIESSTQTGKLFIDLKNSQLKSGMYVKVKVEAFSDKKLIKIPLSLLLDSKYVYGVKNERLVALSVVPEHYFGSEVFISGLENDTFLLKKPLPQAVPNMKVSVVKEEEAL